MYFYIGGRPVSDIRSMRRPSTRAVLFAVLAAVGGACTTTVQGTPSARPTPTPSLAAPTATPTPAETSPRPVQPFPSPRIADNVEYPADFRFRAVPGSGDLTVGVLYAFQLFSHCGLAYPLAWDLDGSFWDPVGDGSPLGTPPEGIGYTFDDGTIELIDDDEARFTSSAGVVVALRRSADTVREGLLCS
jgi:hypothetical protein